MIGHCGGLRPSQSIGDYVLAHAYLRDDHVMDDVLPTEVPIPAIAEVQQALFDAAVAGHRRGSAGSEAPASDRDRGHHRRPQLGAEAHPFGAALQPVARGRDRHGIRRPSPPRATASGSPTAPCSASPTSRSTARSSCPARPMPFTSGRSASICESASRRCASCAARGRSSIRASCAASTSRPSAERFESGGFPPIFPAREDSGQRSAEFFARRGERVFEP